MPQDARRPEEVFTPFTPVSEEMFATRRHDRLQQHVMDALELPGRQLLLYGEGGTGKTSLVRVLCLASGRSVIRVACGQPFEQIAHDVLAALGQQRAEETTHQLGAGAEGSVSVWRVVTGKATVSTSRQTKYAKYQAGSASSLVDALQSERIDVLFFDDLENLEGTIHQQETTRAIAELAKTLADRPPDTDSVPMVIVAGTPSVSVTLLSSAGSVSRRMAQIEVPQMPAQELHQILIRGEQQLGIDFDDDVRDQIVMLSDGFPYYVHLCALHATRRAIAEGRTEVVEQDLHDSIRDVLAGCELDLREQFDAASEATGSVQMRRRVIDALAESDQPALALGDVRRMFAQLYPELASPERLTALSRPIRELRDAGMLRDSGQRGARNRYRFAHPLMRSYVRLRRLEERRLARDQLARFLP